MSAKIENTLIHSVFCADLAKKLEEVARVQQELEKVTAAALETKKAGHAITGRFTAYMKRVDNELHMQINCACQIHGLTKSWSNEVRSALRHFGLTKIVLHMTDKANSEVINLEEYAESDHDGFGDCRLMPVFTDLDFLTCKYESHM